MQLCTPDISVSDALCVFCTRIIAVHISVLDTLGAFCNWRVTTRRRLWGSQISVLDEDEQIFKKIHIFSIISWDAFCATILFQNNGFTVCFVDSSATPRCQSWTRINRFANKTLFWNHMKCQIEVRAHTRTLNRSHSAARAPKLPTPRSTLVPVSNPIGLTWRIIRG